MSVHRSACLQEEGLHLGTLCPAQSAASHVYRTLGKCVSLPLAAVHQPPLAGDWASVALCLLGGPASSLTASPQPAPSPSPARRGFQILKGCPSSSLVYTKALQFPEESLDLETPATAVCLTYPSGSFSASDPSLHLHGSGEPLLFSAQGARPHPCLSGPRASL